MKGFSCKRTEQERSINDNNKKTRHPANMKNKPYIISSPNSHGTMF